MKHSENRFLTTSLEFIMKDDELLHRYIEDFATCKLMLPERENITVLEDLLGSTGAKTAAERLVVLHSLLHFSAVGIRDFWTVIGYLKSSLLSTSLQPQIVLTCLMGGRQKISFFVSELLFKALERCHRAQEHLKKWHQTACQLVQCTLHAQNCFV